MSVKFLGCRSQFEVRVGHRHSVDVVLHIRRQDLEKMRREENWNEFLTLLQESIIPRIFHDEIEASTARLHRRKVPPELGVGGIPIEAGEKNLQARRRKVGGAGALQGRQPPDPDSKKQKEVYYAVGKSVKLAYRLQEPKAAPSATFVVNEYVRDRYPKYRLLSKLSKVICVWGYPCEPSETSNEVGEDVDELLLSAGRVEMIPTTSLFRTAPFSHD